MKIGDGILFSPTEEELKSNIGLTIALKDDKYIVLNRSSSVGNIYIREKKNVESLINVEKVREDIKVFYLPQIKELESQIKTVTSEEKTQERIDKYNDIKLRIVKNCERLIICSDDDEFDNRLKEIERLKKQLFNMDLECGDIIRKQNGKIKYSIKNIEKKMHDHLNNITDEKITKAFQF